MNPISPELLALLQQRQAAQGAAPPPGFVPPQPSAAPPMAPPIAQPDRTGAPRLAPRSRLDPSPAHAQQVADAAVEAGPAWRDRPQSALNPGYTTHDPSTSIFARHPHRSED
jgi:hypothetical protein